MKFSPPLMAQFASETHPMDTGPALLYRWAGGYSQWMQFARECAADDSAAGRFFAEDADDLCKNSRFSGIGQSFADVSRAGHYNRAFEEFKRAEAKLEADRFQPGLPKPAVAGGAWIVPLVLTGNPMPARIRTRTKLPPKNLEVVVNVVHFIRWEDITASVARIARACWDYVEAGGAVSLTVHYIYRFTQPQDGHEGLLVSIKVPLTNQAAFASACSAQEFRGLGVSMARALSGYHNDSLPLGTLVRPGLLHVSGRPADDTKAREALRIR
jgi:hypothetical protein